ncbi:MAG: hypothetical protein HYW22_02980 [Candidatus Aenigmarchaeota archaeon]|nr:hypothetical protein [Candidatus Aenigmarchaeota archaeon]
MSEEANFLIQPRGYYPAVQELLRRTDVRGLRSRDYTEDITPDHEDTLTVVLLPYHKGKVSPRYRTKGGKPLGTFKQPMIAEGFTVKEVGDYRYEVVVGELIRYPELQELADQDNRRQDSWNYIIDWDDTRGVPIKFGSRSRVIMDLTTPEHYSNTLWILILEKDLLCVD